MITKKVSVWYDSDGDEAGWVARCTESEDGQPIGGRIAMDEPIGDGDTTASEARGLAADYWGVDAEDVVMEPR